MHPILVRARLPPALLLLITVLAGCASARDPRDPLEPINRGVYQFNEGLDRIVLKPAARGYIAVVPVPVRSGVTNFFGNFLDVTTAINDLLQGKLSAAARDLGRVAVNSTIGIFGVFDVATRLHIRKHNADFGQTLGRWGFPDGPYLVLPLLGPSNVRDTVGWVGDYFTDPEFYLINQAPTTYIFFGTRVVNTRANVLEIQGVFDAAAMDRYAFLRDAYLQRRRNFISVGDDQPSDNGGVTTGPHRKTLKEMEQELDAPEPGEKQ